MVLGELDQIVAIPCPGRGIAGWFAMGDFLKEMERFDWFIRAVKAGAVPELLRVSPSEPFCGRLHRQVF